MSEVLAQLQLRGQVISVVVVAIVMYAIARWWASVRGEEQGRAADMFFAMVFSAVIAGRLAWLILEAPASLTVPIDVIRVNAGIDLATAIAAASAAVFYKSRTSGERFLELGAILVLGGLAAYSALCLFRQDCFGHIAPAPWGLRFDDFTQTRFPIGIYEAMVLLAGLFVLLSLPLRPWRTFWYAVAFVALAQFASEYGRVSELSRFTNGWRWGWLLMAGAAVALALRPALLPGSPRGRPKSDQTPAGEANS